MITVDHSQTLECILIENIISEIIIVWKLLLLCDAFIFTHYASAVNHLYIRTFRMLATNPLFVTLFSNSPSLIYHPQMSWVV
jgi:hypothetical protein